MTEKQRNTKKDKNLELKVPTTAYEREWFGPKNDNAMYREVSERKFSDEQPGGNISVNVNELVTRKDVKTLIQDKIEENSGESVVQNIKQAAFEELLEELKGEAL